jgi:hypothetical protein
MGVGDIPDHDDGRAEGGGVLSTQSLLIVGTLGHVGQARDQIGNQLVGFDDLFGVAVGGLHGFADFFFQPVSARKPRQMGVNQAIMSYVPRASNRPCVFTGVGNDCPRGQLATGLGLPN